MESREIQKCEEQTAEDEISGKGMYHEDDHYSMDNATRTMAILKPAKRAVKTYRIVKRCIDVIVSIGLAAIALIPMLISALLIVIKDFGNPFYAQKRVGQNGKDIWVVKLRSMKLGSDDIENTLTEEQLDEYRSEYKLDDDPRLIGWKKSGDGDRCFGSLLRRTSLDELPQIFWNILIKGDMAVVGPRPILCEELERNYSPEEQELLLSIKPGLTGYWQAYARNNATYETGERQRMELYYVQNRSLWLDIKILFATVGVVLRQNGAK